MMSFRSARDSMPLFWLLLALPAAAMLRDWFLGSADSMDLLHPSGETSARLMIIAMLLGPLAGLTGRRDWLMWLLARRRAIGVAAFGYAALHMVFYAIDMGSLAAMIDEMPIASIATGWAAFALLLPMAITSNARAMRTLGAAWKRIQRLVYPAASLTLLHWWWIHDGALAALFHFLPLALIYVALIGQKYLTASPPKAHGV